MTDTPKIELVDAKWVGDESFWYIEELGKLSISTDGAVVAISGQKTAHFVNSHNVLALLDHSGELDEYLKKREAAKRERIRRENEEATAHIPKTCLCHGAGWVWRHELSDSSWDGEADDTKYDCPECSAREEGEP